MDDKKPDPEAGDAMMQQSYPSPMVDGADAQYYEQLAQHRELDPQMEHQPAQSEHHGLASMPGEQGRHDHHGLHELQGLQEHPTAQHDVRPSVSADELRLAAQLTEGLAPMMAATAQGQAQEQQTMPQQEGQEGQVQRHAEPNLQEQLEASLQNHEREMQSHEHDLQNHELQDVMSHPDQHPQHHYPHNPPPPTHLAHHMSMDHLPSAHSQYQLSDATPPRKRSKVSRACDECRRKKIKCDAQSEATEQPCSNCRRSNAQCLFSRVPQKRGPSKGYIKELADRINTIEGKLNTNVEGLERRASSETFASPGLGDDSRKRPFANISGDVFQAPSPSRMPAFAAGDYRPILPYVRPDFRSANAVTPENLGLRAAVLAQYPTDTGLQGAPEIMDEVSPNGLPQGSSHEADQLPEIEEAAFNRYLECIHPSFPVLASTKARVQSLVWQSPLTLQRAFYNAFFSMVNPFTPAPDMQVNGDYAAACRLLSEWEGERKPRTTVTDLVRLQTLLMALIAVDCHGIPSVKGELGGPSKTEIVGQAVGLGYLMNLHTRKVDRDPSPELDPNSDDNVALRAWWVLVLLDRWNAASMAKPTLISNDIIQIRVGLKHLVGEAVLCLMRISYTLGFIIPLAVNPVADPFSPTGSTLTSMINLSVENIRFDFPEGCTDPALHLAYWHMRLLAELLSSAQSPDRILQVARKMVEILLGHHELRSPLTSHFIALASLGLLRLLKSDGEARAEAAKLVQDVLDFRLPPSPWNDAVRNKLAEYQLRPGTAASNGPTGQNLQQLADAATAVDGSSAVAAAPPENAIAKGGEHSGAVGAVPNGTAAPAAIDGAKPEDNQRVDAPQGPPVDVRALLGTGYLTCFEEPVANEDGSVV